MTSRFYPLIALAATLLASSCAPRGLTRIDGYLGNDSFKLTQPSERLLAKAATLPKDRHSMPVYPFSEHSRVVRTTAYTCSEWDHKIYGSRSASGTRLMYGSRVSSAAADWSFYPLGTTFRIKGLPQTFIVDDYGSALTGTGTIDLYKPSKGLMNNWGRRNVEVQVLQWGSFKRSAEMLSQRTRYRHCRAMLSNILRQQPALRRYINA